jgi:CBS domain-containing protein
MALLVIVEDDDRISGIVSERDLLRAISQGGPAYGPGFDPQSGYFQGPDGGWYFCH